MFKKTMLVTAVSIVLFGACKTTQNNRVATQKPYSNIEVNGKLYSAVFQQTAAEYAALCIQAFNIASLQLDIVLQENHNKPLAIITDVDETFLDNSPYAVKMSRQGRGFDEKSWNEWTSRGDAEPLLGSFEFFNYAASKNVEIFYITNRSLTDKKGTLENLIKYNFPFADDEHIIVRELESSKEVRRKKISETHEIIMLLGDNLSDFSIVFDKKTVEERLQSVKNNADLFGKKFIVFPNTGYGDWESAIFDYRKDWSTEQKDSIYNSKIKGF